MKRPGKQEDLPEAPEIHVLITLVAEPEAGLEAQFLHD